jgi:hypothetical protein
MTNSREIDKTIARTETRIRSLLDQLEAKTEHDISNPYALDSLTLRLLGIGCPTGQARSKF